MNNEPQTTSDESKIETPVDQTELDEQALEDVNGGLIGLLMPAAQKVREAPTVGFCDGSVMPVGKK